MQEDYLKTFKRICIFFFITIFGLWSGCTDLSYMFSGKTVKGKVTEFYKVTGRRGAPANVKNVSFTFTDRDGNKCQGYDTVGLDWQPDNYDSTVDIVYIPGKKKASSDITSEARLKESSSYAGIVMFFFGLGGLAFILTTSYKSLANGPASG